MDVSGIRSAQDLPSHQASGLAGQELGRKQFLKLMIAQMNNQDPLSPAKNEAFVAQLAQFSTLEGIENLNQSFAAVAGAMRAAQTVQAAALVGRSVLVPGAQAVHDGDGITGMINLDASAKNVAIEIAAPNGALVRRLRLGARPAGDVRFTWDGMDANGLAAAPGAYQVRALVERDGETVQAGVLLPERVVSVSLDNGTAQLNLAGGYTVPLTDVREIQ